MAAYQACHFLGMPECNVHLTQAVVYLALAPKSNALYVAYDERQKGRADAAGRAGAADHPQRAHPADAAAGLRQGLSCTPMIIQDKLTAMQCLPDSLVGREYYRPTEEGLEGRFKTRLETDQGVEKGAWGKVKAEAALFRAVLFHFWAFLGRSFPPGMQTAGNVL